MFLFHSIHILAIVLFFDKKEKILTPKLDVVTLVNLSNNLSRSWLHPKKQSKGHSGLTSHFIDRLAFHRMIFYIILLAFIGLPMVEGQGRL